MSSGLAGHRAAAYSTFLRYWRELAPHILVMKPMTDLCWVCQKNSSAIMKAKNMPDEMKSLVSYMKNYIALAVILTSSIPYLYTYSRQYVLQKNTLDWHQPRDCITKMFARVLLQHYRPNLLVLMAIFHLHHLATAFLAYKMR